MKILVPVKRVSDPDNANKVKVAADGKTVTTEGLEWKPNPFDEYAVETALRLNENAKGTDKLGETIVVTLGPKDAAQTLRQALAMGADRGILVEADDTKLDSLVVARALKAIVDEEKPDVVLLGKQAVDGDSNATAQILAELLGWPQATFAMSIATNDGGKTITVGREVDTGVLTVKVQTPAVISVDLRIVAAQGRAERRDPRDARVRGGRSLRFAQGHHAGEEEADRRAAALGPRHRRHARHQLSQGSSCPPARKAGVFVDTVDDLVNKLKNEAKVL